MQLAVSLVVVVAVVAVWARVCVRLHEWERARLQRATSGRPSRRALRFVRRRRRPVLPEGHRPPPGLGPLSPSERFLRQEAARGLRDLQLFLLDQRTA